MVATLWGLYDRGYWVYEAQRQLGLWPEAMPAMPDPDSPRIREAEEVNKPPLPPDNPNMCRDCPFGLPLRVRSDERYLHHGAPVELNVAHDRRRKKCHSHCGDRFRWLAPHHRVEDLELSDK